MSLIVDDVDTTAAVTWTVTDTADKHTRAPAVVTTYDLGAGLTCIYAGHPRGEVITHCPHIDAVRRFVYDYGLRKWGWPCEETHHTQQTSLVDHLGYRLTIGLYVIAIPMAVALVVVLEIMKIWGWL
jgi:hypothetical protein